MARAPVPATLLAFAMVVVAGIVLVIVGTPDTRHAPPPAPAPVPAMPGVSGGGLTLVSTDVTLPTDDAELPAGPGVDTVVARCTACHSPAMILNQPRLTAEQWTATVTKMREVYKAPVADAEVPVIVAYLAGRPVAAAGE